jgi:hypothetical protein
MTTTLNLVDSAGIEPASARRHSVPYYVGIEPTYSPFTTRIGDCCRLCSASPKTNIQASWSSFLRCSSAELNNQNLDNLGVTNGDRTRATRVTFWVATITTWSRLNCLKFKTGSHFMSYPLDDSSDQPYRWDSNPDLLC